MVRVDLASEALVVKEQHADRDPPSDCASLDGGTAEAASVQQELHSTIIHFGLTIPRHTNWTQSTKPHTTI
eukprot:2665482-Amphidinium_carterae.1